MPRFAAFLRGINVGGHRVTKERLVDIVEGCGFVDVTTWRASGNLLLSGETEDAGLVEDRLERALTSGLGYPVPVLVRDLPALEAVAAANPFAGASGRGKHQVIFLRDAPGSEQWAPARALAGPDDLVILSGREIHWSPSAGVLDSEFDLTKLDRLLGPSTARTMNTIREVVQRLR